MFDLIFDLLGWGGRARSYRYGPKTYDFDHFLDNGRLDQNAPSPDQVSADYFRQNSPSARSARNSSLPYQPDSQPYMQGEEAAAANGMTVVALLAIVAVVVLFVLYMYNPEFHMLATRLLSRS